MRLIIYIELATLGANVNCLVNYRLRILHRVRSATLHCQEKGDEFLTGRGKTTVLVIAGLKQGLKLIVNIHLRDTTRQS